MGDRNGDLTADRNVNQNDDPATRRRDRLANDPAHRRTDEETRTVRVRMMADGEVGEGDQRRQVKAGTAIRVPEDEATSMVNSGSATLADYGQTEATAGPEEDAAQLRQKSRENETSGGSQQQSGGQQDNQQQSGGQR